ncbi:hypothetical protein EVAR_45706_1 [Eumeta japonica]|uniref:Uncharacterized protein n=1 Tax=Eumeta variegata TaxID=151549 RepID=A0A4C1WZ62_EUMVA|nr:hypothetical protein EVAR_45706_1 [Eumeta japonica]
MAPAADKYQRLKTELIKRLTASRERQVKQLLNHEELDDFIRTVWTSRLPSSVQTIIASQSKSTLEEVSELADQIMDVATPSQQITAVSASPGATSESNQIAALTRQVQALAAKLDRMSRPRKGGQPTSVIIYHQPGPCQTTGSFLTAGTTQNSERRRVDA